MKRILLALTGVAIALSGCDKEEHGGTNAAEGRIDLVTGIEALTRAPQLDGDGAGSFQRGDVFKYRVSDGSKSLYKDYTVGETTLYWQDLGLTGGEATFTGCYPPPADASGATFVFNAATAENADLLLAKAVTVAKGTAKITMPFRHAMHKLAVRYVSDGFYDDEAIKTVTTTLRAHSACTVDMERGAIRENSATTPADYRAATGNEASWLVVPQGKEHAALKVTFGNRTREFTLPDRTSEGEPLRTLESGRTLTVTLLVAKDGISFAGTDIDGWEGQGTVNDSIEM